MNIFYLSLLLHSALVNARISMSSGRPTQGINCLGSSQCSKWFNTIDTNNLVALFNWTMWNMVQDDAVFHANRQIACAKNANWAVGGICLYLQGAIPKEGVTGAVLRARISDLTYHGCEYCGSVPVSGDNDARKAGILTSNYVRSPICHGLCFPGEVLDITSPSPIGNDTSRPRRPPRPPHQPRMSRHSTEDDRP